VSHDPKPPEGKKGERRPLRDPGTYWEYNDVRINQLSLALLRLFRRPLPEVFLESVLRPIGGGRDFRWEGYGDAWVEIDGRRVQSVPGGTHWGGGVKISARDQARIGQLLLDGGAHRGRQVIPSEWVRRMHAPCAVAPFYGWLSWLNRDGRLFPDASRASGFMFGAGGHLVWVDPDHQSVVVARWLDGNHWAGFVHRVAQALRDKTPLVVSKSGLSLKRVVWWLQAAIWDRRLISLKRAARACCRSRAASLSVIWRA
jgi:CubicO group peptidase (beta-lactamase class C family)